jgi:protoporphyrinogen oxidase
MKKKAIIIGAGPAGLTAAYELVHRTDIEPVILEKSSDIGGISKTVKYRGNRLDIGGHRFFSKSDRVMKWWLNILPLQKDSKEEITIGYQQQSKVISTLNYPQTEIAGNDKMMLVRNRQSRIYYLKKFFEYPLRLSADTLRKLGLVKLVKISISYLRAKIWPRRNELTLEDFFINRFGKELYVTFFKEYTEKVWGKPCNAISAEWGAQRVKELSIGKAIRHSLRKTFSDKKNNSIEQNPKHTSLIERFLYPKFGPGQLWEEVAEIIQKKEGKIFQNCDVSAIHHNGEKILRIEALNKNTNQAESFEGDYFFSSMPVKDLISVMYPPPPPTILHIAAGLEYRDFITVGLLLEKLAIKDDGASRNGLIKDNWIYIQDPGVKLGRLQIYNNWSPFMVKDPDKVWLGLEYFCQQGDELWNLEDAAFTGMAIGELEKIGFIEGDKVLDSTIIRMEKTYPAYFGTYKDFDKIRQFTDRFTNLFLVGRNGMHKYNNSDHSMLTAMTAVDNIINGVSSKENIWQINTEQEYHENKSN